MSILRSYLILCQIGRRNYMSKSKNILEIRNVTKKFNTPNNKVLTACDNISLEFEEGKKVMMEECRPISKDKKWIVIENVK